MRKVNLEDAFASFSEHWSPRVAGEVNEFQLKLVKLAGAFDWHHHETEDEAFLVVRGRLRMELRDDAIELAAGELVVVPHGIEHRPVALTDPCHVVLFERATTRNTGTSVTDRTRAPVALAD